MNGISRNAAEHIPINFKTWISQSIKYKVFRNSSREWVLRKVKTKNFKTCFRPSGWPVRPHQSRHITIRVSTNQKQPGQLLIQCYAKLQLIILNSGTQNTTGLKKLGVQYNLTYKFLSVYNKYIWSKFLVGTRKFQIKVLNDFVSLNSLEV